MSRNSPAVAGPSRPPQYLNQLTRVPPPQPSLNGVQPYGTQPYAAPPIYRARKDPPAQPQNGSTTAGSKPYSFQPRRPFTSFDLTDMRSRVSRWEAGLTQDAWFDFYKAFGWGEGWIVTRKGGIVYVSDALGKSLPIEHLYQVLGTMLDPDPKAPTMATIGPTLPATGAPQTAGAESNHPVRPSPAAGIPSTVVQPVNPGPSAPTLSNRAPRPRPSRPAPPPAPPPAASTLPRSPAQANKRRLARDVLNALGKRSRTIGDSPPAPAAKRVTTERNVKDDAQPPVIVSPPPVSQPASATSIPDMQPQMGQFRVALTSASTTPASEAPPPVMSVIKALNPPQSIEAATSAIPSAPSAPAEANTSLQPVVATSIEPQLAPVAAPHDAEPFSASAVPSQVDTSDHTSQTTVVEPLPAVAATAAVSSPNSNRIARKTTGGMNRRSSPSHSPSEASTSRLAQSSPQQKQHTPPRPSSVPPPPTSPSDIEDVEEPLFLPSTSAPSSPAASVIDLTASPERPRYKPKMQVYVLVPPPPPYLKPFIEAMRRKRRDQTGKGKAKAIIVEPTLSPAPVEEGRFLVFFIPLNRLTV